MVSPVFIYDETHYISPDDPNGLTNQGIPKFIREQYEETLSAAAWFTYNGMWRSASSGIVRGAAIAAVVGIAAAAVVGVFAGVPGVAEASFGNAAVTGIGQFFGTAGALLPVLGAGAAAGALYDISQHRDEVQKEMVKTREVMRELRGVVRDQQIGKELGREKADSGLVDVDRPAAKEAIVHEFDPTGAQTQHSGVDEWVERSQRRHEKRRQELGAMGQERPKELDSWVAKEEQRRQQHLEEHMNSREV